jgi:hypothetical protein
MSKHRKKHTTKLRRGVGSIEYILILGMVLPLLVFLMMGGRTIMRYVYEMTCVLVSWPFI